MSVWCDLMGPFVYVILCRVEHYRGTKLLRSMALGQPGSALGAENGQEPEGGGLQISGEGETIIGIFQPP